MADGAAYFSAFLHPKRAVPVPVIIPSLSLYPVGSAAERTAKKKHTTANWPKIPVLAGSVAHSPKLLLTITKIAGPNPTAAQPTVLRNRVSQPTADEPAAPSSAYSSRSRSPIA